MTVETFVQYTDRGLLAGAEVGATPVIAFAQQCEIRIQKVWHRLRLRLSTNQREH